MDFIDYDVDYPYNQNVPPTHSLSTSSPPPQQPDVLTSYRCILLNYPVNSTTNHPLLKYYTLWLTNPNPLYPPTDFTPLHHVTYQLSQTILTLFVSLSNNLSVLNLTTLFVYSLLTCLWGILVLKSIDITAWNGLLLVIIILRVCGKILCCGGSRGSSSNSRPNTKSNNKKSPKLIIKRNELISSLGKDTCTASELELVYNRLFSPVRVSYKQFLRVVGCKRGFKCLGTGEAYAVEKRSRVDSLGLLVSGRLVVSQGGKALHVILPFQFVDSPEYFGVATDELFQVTITALEESKLLVWHRDKLRLTIMNDEFLRVMFDHIIGRDVVRKLIQVSDTIMTTTTTTTYSQPTTTTSISTISSNGLNSTSPSSPPSSPSNNSSPNNNTLPQQQQQQPIVMVRKDKYAYQPTYLTSLSEEKPKKGGQPLVPAPFDCEEGDEDEEEDEEDEEEDEDDVNESVCISGNEKEPMLSGGGCSSNIVDEHKIDNNEK